MVKSALRVLEVLELFDAERRPLRIADIVDRLNMPQSSASMLIKTLVARGYMDFDAASREYCPSVRVSFLGAWAVGDPGRREEIIEAMRELAEDTGETVVLGRRSGLFMQYLSVIESQYALRLTLSSGTMRPLHRTAIGILLLSRLDDEQVGRLLRRWNAEHGQDGVPARISDTMRAVEQARRQGHYESENLATPGSGVIAALLATPVRGQYLGIGVGGPVARLHAQRAKLTAAVLAAARKC